MKTIALAFILFAAPLFAQDDISGAGPDGSPVTGNPILSGVEANTAPLSVDPGDLTRILGSPEGILLIDERRPKSTHCQVDHSAVATRSAFGFDCAAPGAGLSIYITEIRLAGDNNTAVGQPYQISYGTGTNCGTGNVIIWATYADKRAPVVDPIFPPYKLPENTALCWIQADATLTKSLYVRGYIGP